MSYLVLARKWRPQTFAEVVGQPHVTRTLQNAIKYNRIPHALLFSGPRGVGKTTVARILAKSLNCEHGPAVEPCNKCLICQEITQGRSLDVYELDAASNRGIDEIREIRENVRYLPSKGRYKVYIVDEVHMLTKDAFNALLKTLEEPPSYVIFIFATTEPHKIPDTIVSRCQRFPFRRIGSRILHEHLKYIAEQEKIEIEDDALWLLARVAGGGLRDALSLLDQVISFSSFPIKAEDVKAILGLFDTQIIFGLMEAILEQDLKKTMSLVTDVVEEGGDIKELYSQLISYWRHLLMIKIDPKASLVDLPDNEIKTLRQLSQTQPLSRLEQFFGILLSEEGNIRFSTQPRFVLEAILIKLADFSRLMPLEEVLQRLKGLSQIQTDCLRDKPTNVQSGLESGEETQVGAPRLETEQIRSKRESLEEKSRRDKNTTFKDRLLNIMKRECPILAAALENANIRINGNVVTLNLPQFHADLLQEEKFFKILKEGCQDLLKDCQIKIDVSNGQSLKKSLEKPSEEFDFLKEVLQIFGGEIVTENPLGLRIGGK